jgi:hypothetical protein
LSLSENHQKPETQVCARETPSRNRVRAGFRGAAPRPPPSSLEQISQGNAAGRLIGIDIDKLRALVARTARALSVSTFGGREMRFHEMMLVMHISSIRVCSTTQSPHFPATSESL